jgi:hypothetical protein
MVCGTPLTGGKGLVRRYASLLALGIGAGLLVAALTGRDDHVSLPRVDTVSARAALASAPQRFGDVVSGRIDILVPREVADPDSVRWAPRVLPYRLSEPLERRRWDDGEISLVRYEFGLECLFSACLPDASRAGKILPPATIRYATTTGAPEVLELTWPTIATASWHNRRAVVLFDFRTGLGELAPVETRVGAKLLSILLLLAALACAMAALALLVPRLLRVLPARPAMEHGSTTLERALAIVRSAAGAEDVAERRRALDLLARELRKAQARRREARTARRLAWSRRAPRRSDMEQLADNVESSG